MDTDFSSFMLYQCKYHKIILVLKTYLRELHSLSYIQLFYFLAI